METLVLIPLKNPAHLLARPCHKRGVAWQSRNEGTEWWIILNKDDGKWLGTSWDKTKTVTTILCSIDLETKWKETKRKTKNYNDEDRGKKVKGEGGWGSWDEMWEEGTDCQRELEKLCEGPMCHRGTQRIGVQGGGDWIKVVTWMVRPYYTTNVTHHFVESFSDHLTCHLLISFCKKNLKSG